MRISTKQIFDSGLQSVQKQTAETIRAQRQIASGEKYSKASESPLAAGLGVQVILDRSQYEMFQINQDFTNAKLTAADAQLKAVNDGISRFRQLLVQAGSDINPGQRQTIAVELEQVETRIAQLLTAQDANGHYVFDQIEPEAIGVISSAPNISIRAGISLVEIAGRKTPASSASAGFVDLYDGLQSAIAEVRAGNGPSAQTLTTLAGIAVQVNEAQVKVGLQQNELEASIEISDVQKANIEVERSNLLDADLAESTSKLVKSNALLQAAQSIMARLEINNLFQKL
jgi:flagellin-like hook-associated protein FlgL